MASYSLTINNRELLLPSPEERLEPQPRLPPLNSFNYSSQYEREHLKCMSVDQILQLGLYGASMSTAAASSRTPWNPLFIESNSRGVFESPFPRTRQSSNIFGPTSTVGRVALGPVSAMNTISGSFTASLSNNSADSAGSSFSSQSRSNSGVSDVFSRHSSISSNTASTACACQECEEPQSEAPAKKYISIQPATAELLAKQKTTPPATTVPQCVAKPKSRRVQKHLTGKSSRQRVGPSCDMCRKKKIKCDAYIEVVEQDLEDAGIDYDESSSSVTDKELVSRFISAEDCQHGFKLLFSNGKLIKFRNCSFCEAKGQDAQFERGFTKEDTVVHSVMSTMKKARKRIC